MPLRVMHVPHMDIVSLLDPITSEQHVLDTRVCTIYVPREGNMSAFIDILWEFVI